MQRTRISRGDEFRIRNAGLEKDLDVQTLDIDFFKIGSMDEFDREEILSERRGDFRAAKYLDLLVSKGGPTGYRDFIDLLKTDDSHLVERLEAIQVLEVDADPWHWFNDVDETKKLRRITDADASRISRCLGKGWEDLLVELGLRKNEIRLEAERSRDQTSQICNLLITWWHRYSKEATLKVLVDKMRDLESGRHLHVDIERLQKVMTEN